MVSFICNGCGQTIEDISLKPYEVYDENFNKEKDSYLCFSCKFGDIN